MKPIRRMASAAALLALAACQSLPQKSAPPADVAEISPPVQVAAPEPVPPPAPEPAEETFQIPEPAPPRSGEEVISRLRERLFDPPCQSDPLVKQWQRRYAGSPQRFSAQINAILPWLAFTLEEIDRYRLPGEFALLPIAESWYRPDARGAGDHVGLWQIGRSTAAYLDLPITRTYDGRMDGLAATDAALGYLASLHNRFGDWKLAVAAYNAGPQRISRLLDRDASPDDALPAGLPNGTLEYLARVQALSCLLGAPERHGLSLDASRTIEPLVPVQIPHGQSTLDLIAADRELPRSVLVAFNPAYRGGFIAADAPRRMLVPQSMAERLTDFELPHAPAPALPAATTGDYVVQRGDTLGAIARRHGIGLQALMQLNGLNGRSILRPGQRLRLAP